MTGASNFAHLHLHSNYSLHRGCVPVDALIEQAAEYRMDTLALADINNIYCAVEFYEKCLEADIRPLIGTELRTDGSSLLLLARSTEGYRSVCRAITALTCEDGISLPGIMQKTEPRDVFIIVFSRELLEHALAHADSSSVFTGIRPQDTLSLRYMDFVLESARAGIRAAALADAFMTSREQEQIYRVVRAIGTHTTADQIRPGRKYRNCRFFGPEEARRIFAEIPESIATAREIADRCEYRFDFSRTFFPKCSIPEGETPLSRIRRICRRNLAQRFHPVPSEAASRLERELRVVEKSAFSEYFLIVHEIMEYARANSIPVCARGSGASSLVTYLLGISDIDPIKYGLAFERFLNSSRTDCPDLDIDICWRKRDELIGHVYEQYGTHRTAMISAHNMYQARSAFRDTALAFGVGADRVNFLSKRMSRDSVPSARELISMLPRSLSCPGDEDLFEKTVRFSRILKGFPRNISIHCGGIVIAPRSLTDHVPLEPSAKGRIITQFEMNAIEKIGLVKIDLLGQRGLSTISETIRLADRNRNGTLSLNSIPDRDPAASDILKTGSSIGCFQIESPGMRSLMKMLAVSDTAGLTAALALIRPGPASAGMKEAFIRRSRGLEPDISPMECLRETHGIMLYQEDIMRAAHEAAGLPYDAGERLRKTLAAGPDRKQKWKMKNYFIRQSVRWGTGRAQAERVWNNIESFASYSFCKAHAAVYALYAYRAAFLKAHVPAEYMTAVMNNHTGMYPRSAYIEEARRLGVNILPPCIHTSGIECSAEGNSLRVGLQEIKGLSLSAMERIVRERGQHTFESPLDFFARVSLSLPEAENLVLCGALDEWKIPRPSLVWLCRNLRPAGSMFGDPVRYPDLPDYSWEKKLEYEYNVLGFICGGHPLLFLKQQKEFRPCLDLASLDSRIDEEIQAAGLGLTARSYSTSRGQVMGFMTIEDETGVAEVTLRSDVYAAHRRIIYSQGPFRIRGTVRRRYGDVSIEAEEIEHISVF